MSYSGEAAEQVVRMTIQGTEVCLRLTGQAAERTLAMIYAIMRDQKKTAGKVRLSSMLKSGREISVFTIPTKDIQGFSKEAKRYGVLYCALKEKQGDDKGLIDIMVYKDDAFKINRIVERLGISAVDTNVSRHALEEAEEKTKAPDKSENPTKAGRKTPPRSGRISKNKETSETDYSNAPYELKRSVRKDMDDLRKKRAPVGEQEKVKPHIIPEAEQLKTERMRK